MDETWECIVVGGGAAGLSAALVLGRARRRTLLVDAGAPSNLVAHGIGGLLGQDGRPPAGLYAAGRAELAAYPSVRVVEGEAVDARRDDRGDFIVDLADGGHVAGRRLMLATGMEYRPPPIAGVAPRFGRSVFHCPFCHGWEVRDRPLAVLDGGATGVERALLLRMWSDDVTLLTAGETGPDDAGRARLDDAGVGVDGRGIAGLVGPEPELEAIAFDDGAERPCGGLLVPVTLHQRGVLARRLGAATTAGPVAADALEVDAVNRTSVPGLFAAGDAAIQMPSVANAISSGSTAAAAVVHSLIAGA